MGKTRNAGAGHGTGGSPQGTIEQGKLSNKVEEIARKQMIQPLIAAGVKFNEKDVLFVTKDQSGQTIWLEKGNQKVGLQHILDGNGKTTGHAKDFENMYGVSRNSVADQINNIITSGKLEYSIIKIINGKEGYEKMYKKNDHYYMLSGIGLNGFVITAYPVNEKKAKVLIRRNKK